MKKLFWALLLIAAVLYSITVYGWWQEGTKYREQGMQEHCDQYAGADRSFIPSGCVKYIEGR